MSWSSVYSGEYNYFSNWWLEECKTDQHIFREIRSYVFSRTAACLRLMNKKTILMWIDWSARWDKCYYAMLFFEFASRSKRLHITRGIYGFTQYCGTKTAVAQQASKEVETSLVSDFSPLYFYYANVFLWACLYFTPLNFYHKNVCLSFCAVTLACYGALWESLIVSWFDGASPSLLLVYRRHL